MPLRLMPLRLMPLRLMPLRLMPLRLMPLRLMPLRLMPLSSTTADSTSLSAGSSLPRSARQPERSAPTVSALYPYKYLDKPDVMRTSQASAGIQLRFVE
jgi:hypothetical protein